MFDRSRRHKPDDDPAEGFADDAVDPARCCDVDHDEDGTCDDTYRPFGWTDYDRHQMAVLGIDLDGNSVS